MKKLPSVSKIGKLVLQKIFKSEVRINAQEDFSRDVTIVKTQIDLNMRNDSIMPKDISRYYIWGLELGLNQIQVTSTQSLLQDIIGFLLLNERWTYPSHVIVICRWSADMIERENVSIYSLTQKQLEHLRNARADYFH